MEAVSRCAACVDCHRLQVQCHHRRGRALDFLEAQRRCTAESLDSSGASLDRHLTAMKVSAFGFLLAYLHSVGIQLCELDTHTGSRERAGSEQLRDGIRVVDDASQIADEYGSFGALIVT